MEEKRENRISLNEIDDSEKCIKQSNIAGKKTDAINILKNTIGLGESMQMNNTLNNIASATSTVMQMSDAVKKAMELNTSVVNRALNNIAGLSDYAGMSNALSNIGGISSPLGQMGNVMRKAMELSISPAVSMSFNMGGLAPTLGQISDSMRKSMELNTSIDINNALKNIAGLSGAVGVGMDSALGISSTLRQMSEAMRKSMNFSISSVGVSNVFNNTKGLGDMLAKISIPSKELRKGLMSIDFDSIKINNDGTVNYLDEAIDIGQTSNEIDEIASEDIPLYDKFEKFKKKHFVVYLIFCLMFNFFIIQPLYSYGSDIVKEKAKSISLKFTDSSSLKNINVNKKEIKVEVTKELEKKLNDKSIKKAILNDYRFVSVNVINVRRNNTEKSPVIYQLHIGQVVNVINKNKNWTLIEYTNDENTINIKGWVNTRYISRFD
ncbi:SH3 domain-containing protein [Clostridium ljungdahlii]|uniref:Bacterial SH3 domain protein n=1 Tax=Clostridium ljungdahlii TaxID=1538 RepID=A0A168MH73_9CLOT|nr:SH3 domain-containing protein [Clostridium ljungdahlii]OAA84684.1 Bacterial SH3 domain protein [Clostridium ljungdahlii]